MRTIPANRDQNGRFVKGNNANPSGRPKVPPDVREAIRAACPKAVSVLVALLDSKKEAYRLEAAKTLLDRGYGKPEVMTKVDLTMQEPTKVIFQWIGEDENPESNNPI